MALLSLDDTSTRSTLTPGRLIEEMRRAFIDLRDGRFELPQRVALADSGYLVMPTRHRTADSLVVKTLSLAADRDPMISGLVSWSTRDHDRSVVAPAETITALRTGAITGLVTDLVADPAASTLAIFGAGALAADQVRFTHAVRSLTAVRFVARTPSRAEPLVAQLQTELPDTSFMITTPTDRHLADIDLVCCATTSTAPLFSATELAETVHVTAVGSYKSTMHEFGADLIAAASAVLVDDLAACMIESGELIDAVDAEVITRDDITELVSIIDRPQRRGGGDGRSSSPSGSRSRTGRPCISWPEPSSAEAAHTSVC
ncbi:ornithine cyclodeaminase family protein [Microlunatus sp. Gsoil 973]|uniref:ornithine cyclodeaminase family protein n=1 Tax=Microlunatus sp. Gsoil 973 TaxID=2672569 RepID=UPI0018A867F8|nr:ornithine cyclodeaminase family protein [Microlunatus sp. Gsoil 973]